MRLLFLHGWGLDASLWDGARAALPDYETVAMDRGYFGPAAAAPVEGPVLAVGHSLGAMLLAGISGLVAVNGFDRFAGEDAVPVRVVERMRRRFGEAPAEVLADFRARIGAGPAPERIDANRLAADLEILANTSSPRRKPGPMGGDAVSSSSGPHPWVPAFAGATERVLVLHGGADPLLPAPMRDAVFAGAPRETLAEGGHLLPLTHPEWVAARIRAFAA